MLSRYLRVETQIMSLTIGPFVSSIFFQKFFESLIHKILLYSVKSDMLGQQHGFFPKRSVETNLVEYVDFIMNAMDQQIRVDSIYTDFSKAFDKIDHNILVLRLAEVGVCGNLLSWLSSYLFNRSQMVLVNGHRSEPFPVTSGVPQGSHLGPLLFLIFLNNIGMCFKHCYFSLYADDLKMYLSINSINDCILLQSDLNDLHDYCRKNKIVLNVEKCCFISFTRKFQNFAFDYNLNGVPLKQVTSIKDLGVILDKKMTFSLHVDYIVSKANKMLGFILRQCRQFTSITAMKALYYSFVHSKLNYASVVWNPHYKVFIIRLEIVQNNFLRYLHYKQIGTYSNTVSTSLLRKTFNFFSLEARREHADIIFLYKIINCLVDIPTVLSTVHFNIQPRFLRNNSLFHEPFCRTNIGKYAPVTRMVRLYNMRYANIDIFNHNLFTFRNIVRRSYEIE